jgi:CBS domain-containing protein
MIEAPVRDHMAAGSPSVAPETTVRDLVELFADRNLTFAPVIDANGQLVGVVSESDLVFQEVEGDDLHQPYSIPFLGDLIPLSRDHTDAQFRREFGTTVSDLMSGEPVTVGADDTVHEAARLIAKHDVSRLPVIDDGKVVGTIGRSEIIRALARLEF